MKYRLVKMVSSIVLLVLLGTTGRGEDIRWGNHWTSTSLATLYMTIAGRKYSHVVVPKTNMTVSKVGVFTSHLVGSPVYHLGVQGDDGTTNHYPDGTWLGGAANYVTTAFPDTDDWTLFDLPTSVSFTNGGRYHLVIEVITALNPSSFAGIRAPAQNNGRTTFRPGDGIYDESVGMEYNYGAGWARGGSLSIVAVDTAANIVAGQPYHAGSLYYSIFDSARVGQLFTLEPGVDAPRFKLKEVGLQMSIIGTPIDDLRIHIERVSDNEEICSTILISTNTLIPSMGYAFMSTNFPASSQFLEPGVQYRIVCEASNTPSANGYYRINEYHGGSYAGAASATFQGATNHLLVAYKNYAWVWQEQLGYGDETSADLVFELTIAPMSDVNGALIIIN